ncbi:uncharacterized protein LOC102899149 [Felis catus]|uniref:uncharacterized protein LOC102899149 n=1 Tax=Felis catus TaxID=9685 RepID=UPI001D19C97E|nr:uncharacterized protein LOC102899149 [Felis catus]
MPRPPLLSSSSLHFLKSFCLLVPWAVRLSHSRHTLPVKFKTEASGERVWHFLSLPLSPASCSPSSPAWSADKPSCEKRGMLVPPSHLSQGPHLAPHPGHPTRAAPSLDKAWGGGTMHQSVLGSYRKCSEELRRPHYHPPCAGLGEEKPGGREALDTSVQCSAMRNVVELERKEGKALNGARAMARNWRSILTIHDSFTLDNHTVNLGLLFCFTDEDYETEGGNWSRPAG